MKRYTRITSLDMYTGLCSDDVVAADEFVDEGAGIYPCFYYKKDSGLYVSTSVIRLIKHKGVFRHNRKFKPARWSLRDAGGRKTFLPLGRLFGGFLQSKRTVRDWYDTCETIDTEVFKVKPFEAVTFDANTCASIPGGDFISDSAFIEKTAYYVRKHINAIEKEFPDYTHVVLAGGKDSLLILLADKINNERWNVFSSEPNMPLVRQWLTDNNVAVNRLYEHDGRNEETETDLSNKIVAGDLFSNPRHMRWLPTLKKIGHAVGGKCFFWAGTMGNTLLVFSRNYHRGSIDHFYKTQFSRGAAWQGNSHQVHKNFTGFSLLSPYHSQELWENVFFRYDHSGLCAGTDFRDKIGEALAGRTVIWPGSNPSPPLYTYAKDVDLYRHYVGYIRTALTGTNVAYGT